MRPHFLALNDSTKGTVNIKIESEDEDEGEDTRLFQESLELADALPDEVNVGASAPTPPGRDPRPAGESMPMWEPAPAGESLLFANKRDSRGGLGPRPVVEN